MRRDWLVSRRSLLQVAGATVVSGAFSRVVAEPAKGVIRFGLTPVFLTNDLDLLERLKDFLTRRTGMEVQLVQRRTYEEITSLLVSGQLSAAWICGYPFVAYEAFLALVAVPVWRGRPLYQSYLIVAADREVDALQDLEGDTHAFSDPNSNSGYLVTRAALAARRRRPDDFFRRSFFTYGHRNVVRAVASGLAESGSVDGYVWEVIAEMEPRLAERTRIVSRSEWLGFPPIACPKRLENAPQTLALKRALVDMAREPDGAEVLRLLRLDGFATAAPSLFDRIAANLALVREFG